MIYASFVVFGVRSLENYGLDYLIHAESWVFDHLTRVSLVTLGLHPKILSRFS